MVSRQLLILVAVLTIWDTHGLPPFACNKHLCSQGVGLERGGWLYSLVGTVVGSGGKAGAGMALAQKQSPISLTLTGGRLQGCRTRHDTRERGGRQDEGNAPLTGVRRISDQDCADPEPCPQFKVVFFIDGRPFNTLN